MKTIWDGFIFSLFLVFHPQVKNVGTKWEKPSEVLVVRIGKSKWNEQTIEHSEKAPFVIKAFTRLRCLCEGDMWREDGGLDDVLFVLRPAHAEAEIFSLPLESITQKDAAFSGVTGGGGGRFLGIVILGTT